MVPRVLRREFLDGLALGAAGLAVGATAKELWPDHRFQ
ncbi:MAG: twin-arginine translocation signal domain-containing protein [Steroidobacteraceae bacterium]